MLYKWAVEYCPNVKYILKTDDDSFVDTFHLSYFLKRHDFEDKENFFLCFAVNGYAPIRDVNDKHFVTRKEYSGDEYPLYCSGGAYVTKIETMKKILSQIEKFDYLFIDDVFLTGIAAQGITTHYDWSDSFLEHHTDSAPKLLSPTNLYYTPQLLAAMNLDSNSIFHLQRKAKNCYENPKCYNLLNQLPVESLRPPKVSANLEKMKLYRLGFRGI